MSLPNQVGGWKAGGSVQASPLQVLGLPRAERKTALRESRHAFEQPFKQLELQNQNQVRVYPEPLLDRSTVEPLPGEIQTNCSYLCSFVPANDVIPCFCKRVGHVEVHPTRDLAGSALSACLGDAFARQSGPQYPESAWPSDDSLRKLSLGNVLATDPSRS